MSDTKRAARSFRFSPNLLARAAVAISVLAAIALVWRALLTAHQSVDDLFIFLRYARNVAERGEFAFSSGERVEGASSVVWTLLLALLHACGFRGALAAKCLSLVCLVAIAVVSALTMRTVAPRRPLLWPVPTLAFCIDCDLANWGGSGMDAALLALGCAIATLVAARGSIRTSGLAFGLLTWLRPEGPFLALFAAIGLALAMRMSRRDLVRLAASTAAPIALLSLIRIAYFGDILPNTFFAKMGAGERDYSGLSYVGSAFARRPLLLCGSLGALIWALFASRDAKVQRVAFDSAIARSASTDDATRRARRALFVSASLTFGVVLFAFIARGDWMPNRRLLVPAIPCAAIACASFVALAPIRRALAITIGAALFGEAIASTDRALDQRFRSREWLDLRLTSMSISKANFQTRATLDWMPTHLLRTIARYVSPSDVVAHVDVGQLPYLMHDVRFLDGFGLVDRAAGRVAFAPENGAYRIAAVEEFFRAKPVVAIVVFDESSGRPFAAAQAAYVGDRRFYAEYTELNRVPTWGNNPCVTFVRKGAARATERETERRIAAWLARVPDVTLAF